MPLLGRRRELKNQKLVLDGLQEVLLLPQIVSQLLVIREKPVLAHLLLPKEQLLQRKEEQ
jgi:hypothetical protein